MTSSAGAKQARHLTSLLNKDFDTDSVALLYTAKRPNRGYTVTWTDGPSEPEMQAAVTRLADQVPLLDVTEFRYDRRSYEPVIPRQLDLDNHQRQLHEPVVMA